MAPVHLLNPTVSRQYKTGTIATACTLKPTSSALTHALCVGKGWQYSSAAAQLMAEFQQKFPWVANLCMQSDSATLLLSDAFPDLDEESQAAKAKAVQSWRSQSVLGRMKLVSCESLVASAAAVREIDAAFAAVCCVPVKQLELMDVGRELLVPPLEPGTTSEVTAMSVDVADCVVFVGADDGTTPPFGTFGVAVAVHDGFVDVLCAEKFSAGTDLEGRVRKGYGARLRFDVLMNLSDMSGAEMYAPTAKPVAAASTPKHDAAAAPPPAAPLIPDGTRGFHQQNGYGRGRPANAITPQALMQAVSAAPMPAAGESVQPVAAVPDFMLNLLGMGPGPPAGQPAAPAAAPSPASAAAPQPAPAVPAATPSRPPGISKNVSKNNAAGEQTAADDMVMRLLQGATGSQAPPTAAAAAPQHAPLPTPPSATPSAAAAAQAAPASSVAPASGGSAGAVQRPEASPVQVLHVPSAASLAEMGLDARRAAINANVAQVLHVAQSVFEKAGNRALHTSAASLAKV